MLGSEFLLFLVINGISVMVWYHPARLRNCDKIVKPFYYEPRSLKRENNELLTVLFSSSMIFIFCKSNVYCGAVVTKHKASPVDEL